MSLFLLMLFWNILHRFFSYQHKILGILKLQTKNTCCMHACMHLQYAKGICLLSDKPNHNSLYNLFFKFMSSIDPLYFYKHGMSNYLRSKISIYF